MYSTYSSADNFGEAPVDRVDHVDHFVHYVLSEPWLHVTLVFYIEQNHNLKSSLVWMTATNILHYEEAAIR